MTPEHVLPHIKGIVAVVGKKVWVSVAGGREGGRKEGGREGEREEGGRKGGREGRREDEMERSEEERV